MWRKTTTVTLALEGMTKVNVNRMMGFWISTIQKNQSIAIDTTISRVAIEGTTKLIV